jgi:hypothetical protein
MDIWDGMNVMAKGRNIRAAFCSWHGLHMQSRLSGSADAMEILINTTHERILRSWLTAAIHFQSILTETPTVQVRLCLLHGLHDLEHTPAFASYATGVATVLLRNPLLRWQSCCRENCKMRSTCSVNELQVNDTLQSTSTAKCRPCIACCPSAN